MKKARHLFVLLLLAVFVLTGCDSLVKTTFKTLETVSTEDSAWQFYYAVQSSYDNMTKDVLNIQDKSSAAYAEIHDMFDNKTNIDRILRDSVIVLDLFYEKQTDAFFVFDRLLNFKAIKDETVAQNNGYRLTYDEKLDWHKVIGGDAEIDSFMSKLLLPSTVTATISTNISGGGENIVSGYTLNLTQRSSFPTNAAEIEKYLPQSTTDTATQRTTTYSFTYSQTSTEFVALAKKQVTNANDEVIWSYSREINIEKRSSINYLTSTVTFANGSTSTKTYRLDQQIQNITLGFDKQVGLLQWNINYNAGQLLVYGEAYYQGRNKYFVKEQYKVINPAQAPYSISKSYTTELAIDGAIYKFKYVPGESTFKHIYEQDVNILKFGLYDNDAKAITVQKISQEVVIQAYN